MKRHAKRNLVVSSEEERLILVDSDDREIGTSSKSECHDGAGILHRAFSLFVFNSAGELLIHQRHPASGCGPASGRTAAAAIRARAKRWKPRSTVASSRNSARCATLEYVYKFEYTAPFGDVGTEHELCWVYAGTTTAEPQVNTTEIASWRWIAPDALDEEVADTPQRFTPWFKLEWHALRGTHRKHLEAIVPA